MIRKRRRLHAVIPSGASGGRGARKFARYSRVELFARYVFAQITDLKIVSIKGSFSVTDARMSSKFRGIDANSNELSHYGGRITLPYPQMASTLAPRVAFDGPDPGRAFASVLGSKLQGPRPLVQPRRSAIIAAVRSSRCAFMCHQE